MVPAVLERSAEDHPVATFFAVAFGYSWGVAGLLYALTRGDVFYLFAVPFAWGPLVGGAVTLRLRGESVRKWVGQVRNWRVGVRWYLLGVALVMVGDDAGAIAAFLLGSDVTVALGGWQLYSALFNFLVTLLVAGALEEFGWRGFAQARLQRRYDAALVSVGVGLVWVAWHVPLMVMSLGSFADPINYTVLMAAKSVLLGWLYNKTGGALPVVMVTHAAGNMPGFLTVTGETPPLLATSPLSASALFTLAVAVVIVWYAGSETLTRSGSLPDRLGSR
ncbi:CPBP family intramembrane glutamic endopeptidase [Halopelagius longus]|uniref:CPBP family intramembrane metalloprotease n=1 Tax=Halopelagius longus TaxID=1236180 RepID=A0A1H1GGJ9_9EURY|nr:type II CAAX endopeptidase family protein [Halopelagius longus]RDI69605.1 CPBP family intramembrane metalloprotease [Halopelagius longus]SDR12317.1 CDP-diacylglycerol--glycerol-3-phosphate 3-phosphatidyltransferase/hypothetical protein [Halopelagius longus]